MSGRTVRIALAVLIASVVVALPLLTSPDEGVRVGTTPADRVLIVSLPGVAWSDVDAETMPTLAAFADQGAVGDVSTRIGRRRASVTDAYLTIGAGTRALAPSTDVAVAVDPADRYGGVSTTDILERRLGRPGFDGIAYLGVGAAKNRNEASAFGAEVGLLGTTLAEAGIDRAVIANADAIGEPPEDGDPPPDGFYVRSAATALMDAAGLLPGGAVGRGLLRPADDAPYGVQLDPDQVAEAFGTVWHDRSVVLVEASDLSRVATYRDVATNAQRAAMRADALAHADALLERLLTEVDPSRDAVLVVSPVSPQANPALGLVALRAPDVRAGWLTSPTTRRAGYVLLADIAPTVLSLLGEEFPDEVEGRTFHAVADTSTTRVEGLVDAAEAARFRDRFLPGLVTVLVTVLVLLTGAHLFRHRLPDTLRRAIRPACYAAMGAVPGSFVAGRFDVSRADAAGHWLVIVTVAIAVAVAAMALDRRHGWWGLLLAAAAPAVLLIADVLTGAHLQVNTVFGYSVAVAGRFTGLGNLAYALLGASALVASGIVVDRVGDRARPAVFAFLVLVVAVDGLPMLGADVGGVMSLIPAFGAAATVFAGRRVGLRTLAGTLGVAVATVMAFAFLDASRPSGSHTHLARLAEHVLDGRWEELTTILERRWQASFGSVAVAVTAAVGAAFVAAIVYAEWQVRWRDASRGPRRSASSDASTRRRGPRGALVGLGVLAVAGLVANDSSVAVPLTTLLVAAPAALVALGSPPDTPSSRENEVPVPSSTPVPS